MNQNSEEKKDWEVLRDDLIDAQAEKLETWGLQFNDDDYIQFIREKLKEERDRIMNEPMTKAHWEKYEKEVREALLKEILAEVENYPRKTYKTINEQCIQDGVVLEIAELIRKKMV